MKKNEYDLIDTTEKKDTVIALFTTDDGSVNLQISKEALLTYIADNNLNFDGDYHLDVEIYLSENLRDVVKSYLEDNL